MSYQAATWLLSCGGAGRSGSKLRLSAAAALALWFWEEELPDGKI